MPVSRNASTRTSQRRNSHQDDTPARTRGRGERSTTLPKPTSPQPMAPKPSPAKASPNITRKATRSALNAPLSNLEVAAEIYASYEDPLFMVFGVPPDFFHSLKKHHGKLPKERKLIVSFLSSTSPSSQEECQSEAESEESSESGAAANSKPSSKNRTGRGRGAIRTGRSARGRGGRLRGRGRRAKAGGGGGGGGGRGRGATGTISPTPTRPSRNAAHIFLLPQEDDDDNEQPSKQTTPDEQVRRPMHLYDARSMPSEEYSDKEDEEKVAGEDSDRHFEFTGQVHDGTETPDGSPAQALLESVLQGTCVPDSAPKTASRPSSVMPSQRLVSKLSLSTRSTSHTPREAASTPVECAMPKLLPDHDSDVLYDSDLPDPFVEDAPSPVEADCEDRADYLLQKRFKPMADVQATIAALTKFPAARRSTKTLYALAENTQRILRAWQDEYLMLDARTAPHMHPAKKACTGGRIPIAPEIFEDVKEADLYGYNYDPKKLPGCQDPWTQRPGAGKSGGRELRARRTRDLLDSAAPSEDDEEEDNEGRPSKRQRKATRKFDGTDTGTGTNTPKKHNGWGGARKKGVSRFAKPSSETPEPESRPAKRAKAAAHNLLHQRIQEMREESIMGSSGDEDSSTLDAEEYSDTSAKRGRPTGSKNSARRIDHGVKQGARKAFAHADSSIASTCDTNASPSTLMSMAEGQSQFPIDEPPTAAFLHEAGCTDTVFRPTPQTHVNQELFPLRPSQSQTADAYMTAVPLSRYTNNYIEGSPPLSGPRQRPRVKSEKRSQSMTIWWAERKARIREQDEKNMDPTRLVPSRSNSATKKDAEKSGSPARISAAATTTTQLVAPNSQQLAQQVQSTEQLPQPQTTHQSPSSPPVQSPAYHRLPRLPPQSQLPSHTQSFHNALPLPQAHSPQRPQPPPYSQQIQQRQPLPHLPSIQHYQPTQQQHQSPHRHQPAAPEAQASRHSRLSSTGSHSQYAYHTAPPPPPPPPQLPRILQHSSLAAIPPGPFSAYPTQPMSTSQPGPRPLAPGPMPSHLVSAYPSPYGPQNPAGLRSKNSSQLSRNGPLPLAPAPPAHFNPFGSMGMDRPMPFKMMMPSSNQSESRKESR